MDAIWDLSWRAWPAAGIGAAGLLLLLRGMALAWRGARTPLNVPGKNFSVMRGLRAILLGGSLAAVAAGWTWQIAALVAAGLAIGFEETLETSIATWALKQEYESDLRTARHLRHG
jgi:hypothetical protein